MRVDVLVVLLLSACAPVPEHAVQGSALAPPPGLTLELELKPIALPCASLVDVWNVPANKQVVLLAGTQEGQGPCPRGLGGCVDIVDPVVVGTGVADAAGHAVIKLTAPRLKQSTEVVLQAGVLGTGVALSPATWTWVHVTKGAGRGVWFWRDTGDPWGAAAVVGDPLKETQAIARLTCWGVRRLYGAYDWSTPTHEADIAAWHVDLRAAGVTPQLLLSENTWIDPVTWPNLQTLLQERWVDFQANHVANERFGGLHFDIEPHALPAWATATEAQKRQLLDDYLDMLTMIDAWLAAAGHPSAALRVDLPVWYDNLPPALGGTGQIGWTSAADRDAWFAAVEGLTNGLTLMPFERFTLSSIQSGVSWEKASVPGEVRVALEADIGAGALWPQLLDFTNRAGDVEAAYGSSVGIDIQSFPMLAPIWTP